MPNSSRPDGPGTAYARLYLDSGLNHSAGYFPTPDTPLENAQRVKIDAILRRCGVRPGDRLLDVGCGWGTAAITAAADHGARVIGLTLDPEQHAYARKRQSHLPGASPVDFRLHGWEDFDEPVDRIICVNAFENFERKEAFFPHVRELLTAGGVMVVLTVTADRPLFRVISKDRFVRLARAAGFDVEISDSLAAHYVRTLECFVANLEARRGEAAAIRGEEAFGRHLTYYQRCTEFLRSGANDMYEFTCVAR